MYFNFLVFLVKNCKKFVLLMFSVKRLLWNQFLISVMTVLILVSNSSGFSFYIIMLVSSATNIELAILFKVNGKLLMYIRKSNGRITEPCRTPCFTCSHVDVNLLCLLSFIITLWYLLTKYDLIICKLFWLSHKISVLPGECHG